LVGDGSTSGIGGFREGEGGDGHDSAHFEFGVVDAAGDFAETSVRWGGWCQIGGRKEGIIRMRVLVGRANFVSASDFRLRRE